ncbi:MAG: hypothetical protein ACRD2C_20665 [Acidimicrobiales bacterium]
MFGAQDEVLEVEEQRHLRSVSLLHLRLLVAHSDWSSSRHPDGGTPD